MKSSTASVKWSPNPLGTAAGWTYAGWGRVAHQHYGQQRLLEGDRHLQAVRTYLHFNGVLVSRDVLRCHQRILQRDRATSVAEVRVHEQVLQSRHDLRLQGTDLEAMDIEAALQTGVMVLLGALIFWALVRRRLVRQWVIFAALGLGYGFGSIGEALGQTDISWWYWCGVGAGAALGVGVYLARRVPTDDREVETE